MQLCVKPLRCLGCFTLVEILTRSLGCFFLYSIGLDYGFLPKDILHLGARAFVTNEVVHIIGNFAVSALRFRS